MQLGIIGLGKMGGNIAKKLLGGNHTVYAYDASKEAREIVENMGAQVFSSEEKLCDKLNNEMDIPILWVMLPSGDVTENAIFEVLDDLKKGSIIIDGGNSFYKDTVRRAKKLKDKGFELLDIGTSGGVLGSERGYCFMAGGNKESYELVKPILKELAMDGGYDYMGPSGSGHFVKMVHNGIEYAMMQAYGEGFEILKSKSEFKLDLEKISRVWTRGSVIDSWLLELCTGMFEKDGNLEAVKGYVEDSGEGRWTVLEAIEEHVSSPVIALSLMQRFRSRKGETFSDKVIAGLRREFGGHSIKEE